MKYESLSDKIECEGETTWGTKQGWLDTEDLKEKVKELIEVLKDSPNNWYDCILRQEIKRIFGDKLI